MQGVTFITAIISQFSFWLMLGIGLMVGSFLNILIDRLPQAWFGDDAGKDPSLLKICLLSTHPRTHRCQQPIIWRDNIPVLSWLLARGRCRHCYQKISARYILVEILTSLVFTCSYLWFGQSITAVFYCLFFALLIVLFCIDLETYYLPDFLTYGLLWLGLLGSAVGYLFIETTDAVLGAAMGYGLPWTINYIYQLIRKRDGFGGGDFKLLAGLGAWLGVAAIIPVLALACILTLLTAGFIMLLSSGKISLDHRIPFGPFLILAGIFVFIW